MTFLGLKPPVSDPTDAGRVARLTALCCRCEYKDSVRPPGGKAARRGPILKYGMAGRLWMRTANAAERRKNSRRKPDNRTRVNERLAPRKFPSRGGFRGRMRTANAAERRKNSRRKPDSRTRVNERLAPRKSPSRGGFRGWMRTANAAGRRKNGHRKPDNRTRINERLAPRKSPSRGGFRGWMRTANAAERRKNSRRKPDNRTRNNKHKIELILCVESLDT